MKLKTLKDLVYEMCHVKVVNESDLKAEAIKGVKEGMTLQEFCNITEEEFVNEIDKTVEKLKEVED